MKAIWLFVFLAFLVFLVYLGSAADGPDASTELRRLFPDLSPEIASHLVNDDAEQFERFAAHTPTEALVQAYWCLTFKRPTASMPKFLHADSLVEPYERRLIDAIHPIGFNLNRARHEAYSLRSPEDRIEIIRLKQAIGAFDTDTTSVETREATLLRLIDRAKSYTDAVDIANLYGLYAALVTREEEIREEEILHYTQLGVEAALACGDSNMACQLLGSLGMRHEHGGRYEMMHRCFDRALAIARATHSWQEARIYGFLSHHYRSQGQLAFARDLVLEAQDRSRELGGGMVELRYVNEALHFFAELDCWSQVGRGLPRAEQVYKVNRSQMSPQDVEHEGKRLESLRAWYYAATGRCEEAQDLARAVVNHVDHWSLGPTRGTRIRLAAARALATCGLTTEARRALEDGLEQVRALVGFHAIELAQVCLDLGDLDACERTLDAHPPEAASRESVRYAILRIRLAMLRNDRPAAFVRLQEGLTLLDAMEARLGGSPEAYIALAATDELRRLGHELLDDSAAAGYAFEMRWRGSLGLGSHPSGSVVSESAFMSALVVEAEKVRRRLAARNAVHCIYDIRDDRVVRFTADESGVRREVLACSPGALETHVEKACASLAAPSPRSESLHPTLAEDLRQLAAWLLPDSIRQGSRSRLFLSTANGILARLRFEALNVGTQGFAPLLDRVDVASIRHWREGEQPQGDSALVVSNPVYSPQLRRRYSILTEALPASAVEAATADKLLPRSVELSGAAATKHNIVESWQRARVVYYTGHSIQDPELPYLMFIPVSESLEGGEADSYLEVADIRNADLSGCELVVLSSCGSGAPYLDGKVVVPSLADVFVDAGARAVVSTGWTVHDDDAARIMTSFLQLYAAAEKDPIAALCSARRALAAVTKDPHIWAAYSITLGGLPATAVDPLTTDPLGS